MDLAPYEIDDDAEHDATRDPAADEARLRRYRQLRDASKILHSSLARSIPKTALLRCARRLGLGGSGRGLVFDTPFEADVLHDYCIYDHRELAGTTSRPNAVEWRLIVSPPPPGSDELLLLQAGARARYCLLVVDRVAPGGVRVRDLLLGEAAFLLTDLGLGLSARPGLSLATRVITVEGITFATGATLPIPDEPTAREVALALAQEIGRPPVDGPESLSPRTRARMSAAIIRACLAHGASSNVTPV